jgi:SAM-dependent methyltransferase
MRDANRAVSVHGQYDAHWSAASYLRQYYSAGVSADELANARFVSRQLRQLGRKYEACLEFGCGPTVHHLVNLVPYVGKIRMADYLPENLAEVRRWLGNDPLAFDWDPWLRGMMMAEEESPLGEDPEVELGRRKALMRSLVTQVGGADVRLPDPLNDGETFDLIGTWYCLECVGSDREAWRLYLRNLTSRLKPGGVLMLGALRQTTSYHVLGRVLSVTPIGEKDFMLELPKLGYSPGGLEVEVVPVPEFVEQGFDSICCVRAVKCP